MVSVPGRLDARLPSLDENPWFGMFAAHEDRDLRFTFSDMGKVEVRPIANNRPLGMQYIMSIDFYVRETRANGRVTNHTLVPESFTTEDEATTRPEKFTVRAKTKDDAEVEIVVERQRNGFAIGGRLVDKGKLTSNPVEFAIRTRFRDFYYHVSDRESRTHTRNVRGDEARLRLTDGKRERVAFNDEVENPEALAAMNIAQMQLNIHGMRGKTVEYSATENARINIDKTNDRPMTRGFHMFWTADPEKNVENTERLEISVR